MAIHDQMSCDLEGEAVILSFQKGVYYTLNNMGTRIWMLIQEPVRVEKIRDALLQEFEVEADQCEEDIFALLNELLKEGLITIDKEKDT